MSTRDDDPEPDAWELLQQLRDDVAKNSYRWGVVYDLGIEGWVCGPLEKRGPELYRERVGTGPTPQEAIRDAWNHVHQEEAV